MVANEQPPSSRTPIRPAPSAPTTVSHENTVRSEKLKIGQPVLDATTSSTVRELVSVPLKPAPPIPTVMKQVSVTVVDNKNNSSNNNGGGYPTLRRITSFMKNQKPEEKKPPVARVNSKFDKEVLKNLEISEPILQNEINVPSEPLPLEAEQHKAVVLRAQSLRTTNNTKHRPSVPNFGSMRSKRPTSEAAVTIAPTCSRPTAPPPQPPPPPTSLTFQGSYQVPQRPDNKCDDNTSQDHDDDTQFENIYSVIDESPANNAENDSTYKVPRSLESSLLGEIVSAIQERNHESIYTSKPAPPIVIDKLSHHQQTYENFESSSTGSTTSSGYMCPVDLKLCATSYNRPDLVKNCDDNRSLNRSPDVLEAKKSPLPTNVVKPTVLFPKPVVGVAAKPSNTATVGLKKKLSDSRQPSRVIADIQKRFENTNNGPKNPPVAVKPTFASNR